MASLSAVFRIASHCRTGSAAAGPWRCSTTAAKIFESSRTSPPSQRCSVTPILNFCTASTPIVKKKKSKKNKYQDLHLVDQYCDSSLIRVLNSEIDCALHSDLLDCDVDIPDGFPFKVHDIAGGRIILLEREFQEETIVLQVDMPTTPAVASGYDDDALPETETEHSISVVVTVSKRNGSCFQFVARAFPGRILVNGLSFSKSANSEDPPLAYRGPLFSKLNENFQKAIHDYLETRGLTSSTANFWLKYMISKDTKEYLWWLRSLKNYIEQ